MIKRKNFLIILIVLSLLGLSFNLFSQPVIKAEIDKVIYKPGETIDVNIKVSDNPGLHGIFFYLNYNSSAVQVEDVIEGLMIERVIPDKEFLYALDNGRIIAGFTLKENGTQTLENGVLATIKFKVIGGSSSSISYNFGFSNAGVRDIDGNMISGAVWENSQAFYIYQDPASEFIMISQPSDYDVLYEDNVNLYMTFTANSAYNVKIENIDTNFVSNTINAGPGYINGYSMALAPGYNRISAKLLDGSNNILVEDNITLIRSDEDKYIKIITPEDHALVNTNVVLVKVKSSFDNVRINGMMAEQTDEVINGEYFFNKKIWLKEGFNTIKAESTGTGGENYKDEIVVYYEKALDIFRFLRPLSNELLKTKKADDNEIYLNIIGEISSLYKDDVELNTVTLQVVYYPDNPVLNDQILLNNELADISDSNLTYEDACAPYMFTNKSKIKITGLAGTIDMVAYLNKVGSNSDEVIERRIYVNNEKLWIDLIKPHIYSSDILDTNYKIKGFNEGNDPVSNNINVYNGVFSLINDTNEIKPIDRSADFDYDYIEDMIELADGSIIALSNFFTTMQVWKKEFGSTTWKKIIENKDMYGYKLCNTGMGILIGVSNKFNNKSGLYLLEKENEKYQLTNITIGEPIGYVQFIKNIDGTIYLYGNNYLYLYSFYLYSLETREDEENNEKYYEASNVNKTHFDNTLYIKDFILSKDLKTAVILTKYGEVFFYQQDEELGFIPSEINEDSLINGNTFNAVIEGEYDLGDYNSYLLFNKNSDKFICIMEEKDSNILNADEVVLSDYGIIRDKLLGIGFKDNQYYFLLKNDLLNYEIIKGKIFFNKFYLDDSQIFTSSTEINTGSGSYNLLITNYSKYFQGFGRNVINHGEENIKLKNLCIELFEVLADTGSISFKYKNTDIEGLMGFSFEVDPLWLENSEDYLKFNFKVCDNEGNPVFPEIDFNTFEEFLNHESSFYKINSYYDVELEKEIISVDFNELQTSSYIDFNINFKQLANESPEIEHLTVYKKIKVKIPKGEEETVLLPIKGIVYDPTVTIVHIAEKIIPLEADGSFSYDYEIKSTLKEKPMSIWCENNNGERVYINFIVEIFESINDLAEIGFKEDPASTDNLEILSNTVKIESENIYVSGMFFGLEGAIVGYELYYYEYDGEEIKYIPISKGVFDAVTVTGIDPIFNVDIENQTGYITGEFTNAMIKTYPGKQQLRLYVENPGGKRTYFMPNDDYIDILYDLPLDMQEIVIVNEEVEDLTDSDQYYFDTILYDKALPVKVTDMYDHESGIFKFKKIYNIYGEVKALENIGKIRLKSVGEDNDVRFSNGEKEITLEVDELNRFTAEIEIYIPDEKTEENYKYKIAIIPDAPFLDFLKTGVEIRADKSYEHACIQPDFYFTNQDNWSEEELDLLQKKIELKFDRPIPANSTIDLILNFEHEFTGKLVENGDSGIYFVHNEDDEQIYLTNVKIGTNRLQWAIKYNDRIINYSSNRFINNTYIMQDHLFDIIREDIYNTRIDFPIDENTYYDNNSTTAPNIPLINIQKEKTTKVVIKLNDYPIWEDLGTGTVFNGIDIYQEVLDNDNLNIETLLREGKNKVEFEITEVTVSEKSYTIERELLYDSKPPVVLIGDYKYVKVEDDIFITEFSAIVKEANIRAANLIYNESIISDADCTIKMSYLGDDQYKITYSGLENQYPLVQPSPPEKLNRSLYVFVKDHTGKTGQMDPFYGLINDDIFELDDAIRIDIRNRHYQGGNPPDGITLHDDNGNVYNDTTVEGRLRFYNDRVELIAAKSADPGRVYKLARSEEVRISNDFSVESDGRLKLYSNGKMVITEGHRFSMVIPNEGEQTRVVFDSETTVPDSKAFFFQHKTESNMLSLAFLFRLEKHNDFTFYDINPGNGQKYFRVLTFYYNHANHISDACLYLAYAFNDAKTQYYFTIVREIDGVIEELPGMQSEYFDVNVDWHTVLVNFFDTPDFFDEINFAIDRNPKKTFIYDYSYTFDDDRFPEVGLLVPSILEVENSTSDFFLFGAGTIYGLIISEDEEVGNFSIAHPFYTAQNITTDQVTELMDSVYNNNPVSGSTPVENGRFYTFDDAHDDEGDEDYELRYIGYKELVNGWFDEKENVEYDKVLYETSGALRGSGIHKNYLDNMSDEGYPVFTDSDKPAMHNIECTANPLNSNPNFILKPLDYNKPGQYYFSNNQGNHGLKTDSQGYYSVSGRVINIIDIAGDSPAPKICLRINGVQQEYELQEGDFHFVFDGRNVGKPDKVVLYIETQQNITIESPIVFTEGNYDLAQMGEPMFGEGLRDFDISYATTKYKFENRGTVNLWYKSFQANKQGYVNYEAVIFDSSYLKIYTEIDKDNGRDYAVYMAKIKNPSGGSDFVLKSTIPVQIGWHNIQVSYDQVDDDIAYLYIDGNLAAKLEGAGIAAPDDSLDDTVYFGSNINQTVFTNGYIDNIDIKSIYSLPMYTDTLGDPMHIEYNEDLLRLDIDKKENFYTSNIEKISYVLESLDGDYREVEYYNNYRAPQFDIEHLMSGSYILKTKYEAPYRYEDVCNFTKDNIPNFLLKDDYTGLIIKDVLTDINFNLLFDDSYLIEKEYSKFAGFGIRLNGDGTGLPKTYVVLQGYKDHDHNKWYIHSMEGDFEDIECTGKIIPIVFEDIMTNQDLEYDIRPFYYDEEIQGDFNPDDFNFDEHNQIDGLNGIIPAATLSVEKVKYLDEYEYKLNITVGTTGNSNNEIFDELSIIYELTDENGEKITDTKDFNGRNLIELFYDDILPHIGEYDCTIKLDYRGKISDTEETTIIWKEVKNKIEINEAKVLNITTFSLLDLDMENDTAQVYLEVYSNNLESTSDIIYEILIDDTTVTNGTFSPIDTYTIIDLSSIPKGSFIVKVKVYTNDPEYTFIKEEELNIINAVTAPRVVLTSTVESLIGYNNLTFTWIGYHEGQFKEEIKYSYNFDGKGWSAPTSQQRKVEFYNMAQGNHEFLLKAIYKDVESQVEAVRFYVDIENPVFDPEQIEVIPYYDYDGFLTTVDIHGKEGAVMDQELEALFVNDQRVVIGENGTFLIEDLDIIYDGINTFTLVAIDRVGNYSKYDVEVDNTITNILFPKKNVNIRFAPMTIVGQIRSDINVDISIYARDPQVEFNDEDYIEEQWKKAKINEDRVFFIENVYVNPGTASREAYTPIYLAVKTKSGRTYYKQIDVWANSIVRPIDMELSAHSVEGQNADTEITISCKANVTNISSWSIDYTGDGIYDDVIMVDNPDLGKQCEWMHTYSSLGLAKPRVRIITLDGNYFSVSDQIIIHEKIKEASHKMINTPVAMDSIKMEDNSERVYVLAGANEKYTIEVFEVGRNESYISERLYSISLVGLGIDNPVKIAVLDKDHIYIATNKNGIGYIYVLKSNEFGNYLPVADRVFYVDNLIESITVNNNYLYITSSVSNYIAQVKIEDKLPLPATLEYKYPEVPYEKAILSNLEITKDVYGLLISDYYNQRIIRLTDNCKVVEYFGQFGDGESEFLNPSHIDSYENRVFVYDKTRKDIQIFDQEFKPVSRLYYNTESADNYMTEDFLNDIGGLSIVARAEGNRLYYYALILSKSTNKLAMLRLPQWEELRARVRNNKIVFINNREVYTAKPSGGDLSKIISSDSIPRIEGTIDYPAISPDGRILVFTSRVQLYDGTGSDTAGGNQYAYDNLYTIDIDGQNLQRIPLGEVNYYEIERPVFNSNGDKIIFSAKPTGGLWQIYIYDRKTGGIEKLFDSDENARFPYYSPNDRFVVFTTDYDGDEDVEIVDTQNTTVRLVVTKNNARDSFPVWNRVYPYEVEAQDTDNGVDTKIAFVSERDGHKGIYYVYIATNPQAEDDIHIYNIVNHQIIDTDPDTAAIHITLERDQQNNVDKIVEGDYPCFTGDGKALVFEYFNGEKYILKKCDFELNFEDFNEKRARLQGTLGFILEDMNLTDTARRPSGMKNMITNFTAVNVSGDEIELKWNRYTDNDIYYYVEYQEYIDDDLADEYQKKISSQDNALLKGLKMGHKYIVRVYIVENEEEVATSTWEEVKIPVVAAKPTVWTDDENPYLVHMEAWKPTEETEWVFSWIIDNQEITTANNSTYFNYEFATSGRKYITLKVEDKGKTHTSISQPVAVDVISDITPVITYKITYGDVTYIELSSEDSLGYKIKPASSVWTITGPGLSLPIIYENISNPIITIDKVIEKINVNLKITREMVNGQNSTDIIEKNVIIPLDYPDIKPVITPTVDPDNPRIITFMGDDSIGNIDWKNAEWIVYADSEIMNHINGVSSFVQQFPENTQEKTYTISLTLPSLSDGKTKTVTHVVSIEPCGIVPIIEYEIITEDVGPDLVSAKLVLNCTNSKGNNIDYSQAVWNVPIAASSGESPKQIGPTAVYSLMNIGKKTFIDVSLTLIRRGGGDAQTVTQQIIVDATHIQATDLVVNITEEQGTSGTVLVFDVLDSKGPDIQWDNTTWMFNGQIPVKGPVARYDVTASGEDNVIRYVCTLYRHGDEPIVKTGEFNIKARYIKPEINSSILDQENNVFELDVLESDGMNIDWDKTTWYIFDGNKNVTTYRGSKIMHAFSIKEEAMGYPVLVEMYFKNDSMPFVGYKSIDVEGNELMPIIKWDLESDRPDENVVHFSAHDSLGHNIDWPQTKWTFGDTSEAQYGPVAIHKYPISDAKKEYKVSLTIFRKLPTGEVESKTVYKNINIDSDEIKPVITAVFKDDGNLILSAEDSEGRGLLLDRSLWLFNGVGDNQSFNITQHQGTLERTSDTTSNTTTDSDNTQQITAHGKVTNKTTGAETGVTGTTIIPGQSRQEGTSNTVDTTDYSNLIDNTESFSTSNMHTGAVCRRYIGTYDIATGTYGNMTEITVSLTVYRVGPDGGIIGRQIIRTINLKDARKGKRYE